MNPELDKVLCKKYSKIFAQRSSPMTETLMCWGFECGDGWYWLIDNLCHSIQGYVDSRNDGVKIRNKARSKEEEPEAEWEVEAVQVKEKFGELRFYIHGGDDMVHGMIHLAEDMSWNICEVCGSTKDVTHTKGWIKTVCRSCFLKPEEKK